MLNDIEKILESELGVDPELNELSRWDNTLAGQQKKLGNIKKKWMSYLAKNLANYPYIMENLKYILQEAYEMFNTITDRYRADEIHAVFDQLREDIGVMIQERYLNDLTKGFWKRDEIQKIPDSKLNLIRDTIFSNVMLGTIVDFRYYKDQPIKYKLMSSKVDVATDDYKTRIQYFKFLPYPYMFNIIWFNHTYSNHVWYDPVGYPNYNEHTDYQYELARAAYLEIVHLCSTRYASNKNIMIDEFTIRLSECILRDFPYEYLAIMPYAYMMIFGIEDFMEVFRNPPDFDAIFLQISKSSEVDITKNSRGRKRFYVFDGHSESLTPMDKYGNNSISNFSTWIDERSDSHIYSWRFNIFKSKTLQTRIDQLEREERLEMERKRKTEEHRGQLFRLDTSLITPKSPIRNHPYTDFNETIAVPFSVSDDIYESISRVDLRGIIDSQSFTDLGEFNYEEYREAQNICFEVGVGIGNIKFKRNVKAKGKRKVIAADGIDESEEEETAIEYLSGEWDGID